MKRGRIQRVVTGSGDGVQDRSPACVLCLINAFILCSVSLGQLSPGYGHPLATNGFSPYR